MFYMSLVSYKTLKAFTLAELLISLALLGIISTFTISKVITTQSDVRNKALAKETASMLAEAQRSYSLQVGLTGTTQTTHILDRYLNYVRLDTSTTVDAVWNTRSCSTAGYRCYVLHNGGIVHLYTTSNFGGTGALNAAYMYFDPDGRAGGTQAILFVSYYNGRLRTLGTIENNTLLDSILTSPQPSYDPIWFSWD